MQPDSGFYVTGGSLRPGTPSYVERTADQELYESLLAGELCYVLTSRQTGKSSLMVRTVRRLRDVGIRAVALDLNAVGQNLSSEQWYYGLLCLLGEQTGREPELAQFWREHAGLGPLQRFFEALRRIVLSDDGSQQPGTDDCLVLFIDEIDAVRSLPFSTDELFAAIRESYNRRAREPEFYRLTFCLLGVASPADLIRDTRATPFNIGRRIELEDFDAAAAASLASGLGRDPRSAARLLSRILYWTGGHPYLTQRLCRGVAEALAGQELNGAGRPPSSGSPASGCGTVDRVCAELFLSPRARERDENLVFVRERLLHGETDRAALLELYGRILAGRHVEEDNSNPLIDILHLSGVVTGRRHSPTGSLRPRGAHRHRAALKVRNRIYARVFDPEWVRGHMPDAEVRRQRAAFRRGLLRATALASLVVGALGALAMTALGQAHLAREVQQREVRLSTRLRWALDEQGRTVLALEQTALQRDREARRAREAARRAGEKAAEARRNAEIARHNAARAARSAATATRSAQEADELRLLAEDRLVQTYLVHGTTRLEEGTPFDALPWFAEVLRLEQARGSNAEMSRLRLALLLRQHPQVIQAAFDPGLMCDADLSPDGTLLATAHQDGSARIRDMRTGRLIGLPLAHAQRVHDAVFSPDGRRVVTASWDGTARVWSAATSEPLSKPLQHAEAVFRARFSEDGRYIATASGDRTGRVWDAATGDPVTPPLKHDSTVWRAEFSPDGTRLVTASADRTARIWDVRSGAPVGIPMRHRDWVNYAEFSPDGGTILTASRDGSARLWDGRTGRPSTPPLQHALSVERATFSPDGTRVVTASSDQTARVWDAATGQAISPPLVHRRSLVRAAFSPDGHSIVTATGRVASGEGEWTIWDAVTWRAVIPPVRCPTAIVEALFDRTGKSLLVASDDGTTRLCALEGPSVDPRKLIGPARVAAAQLSADSRRAVTVGRDGTVTVWELGAGQPRPRRRISVGSCPVAFAAPDLRRVFVVSDSGKGQLWDITGAGTPIGPPIRTTYTRAVFSRDGRRMAVWSARDGMCVYDTNSGAALTSPTKGCFPRAFCEDGRLLLTRSGKYAEIMNFPEGKVEGSIFHGGPILDASPSPEGRLLVTIGVDGTAAVWEFQTRRLIRKFAHGSQIHFAAFGPGGRRLVVGSGNQMRVWSIPDGRPLTPNLRHSELIVSAAFSPDEKLLAVSSRDGAVRLWDTRAGLPAGPTLRHAPGRPSITFSEDGRGLLICIPDGEARIWDLTPDQRPTADLILMAHFLAGHRVDRTRGLAVMAPADLEAAWRYLRARYPGEFALKPEAVRKAAGR